MSLVAGNGGVGQSPAISRINRLTPEWKSRENILKMRRVAELVETRACDDVKRAVQKRLWSLSAPIGINPSYPDAELNVRSLAQCIAHSIAEMT